MSHMLGAMAARPLVARRLFPPSPQSEPAPPSPAAGQTTVYSNLWLLDSPSDGEEGDGGGAAPLRLPLKSLAAAVAEQQQTAATDAPPLHVEAVAVAPLEIRGNSLEAHIGPNAWPATKQLTWLADRTASGCLAGDSPRIGAVLHTELAFDATSSSAAAASPATGASGHSPAFLLRCVKGQVVAGSGRAGAQAAGDLGLLLDSSSGQSASDSDSDSFDLVIEGSALEDSTAGDGQSLAAGGSSLWVDSPPAADGAPTGGAGSTWCSAASDHSCVSAQLGSTQAASVPAQKASPVQQHSTGAHGSAGLPPTGTVAVAEPEFSLEDTALSIDRFIELAFATETLSEPAEAAEQGHHSPSSPIPSSTGAPELGLVEAGALSVWPAPLPLCAAAPHTPALPAAHGSPGLQPSGQYASLLQRYEQRDFSRTCKVVRASLKREQAVAAAAAAAVTAASKPATVLERLAQNWLGKRGGGKLRRLLERQRLQLLCLGRVPYNPDDPLHFETWQAVCRGFTGLDAAVEPSESSGGLAPWQALGFRAANPAGDLAGTGVLPLLLLLLLLDHAPQQAERLVAASQGAQVPLPAAQQAGPSPGLPDTTLLPAGIGFSLASVAVELSRWVLHLLRTGGLAEVAKRLESTTTAAEEFWLGAVDCFLASWEAVVVATAAESVGSAMRQQWWDHRQLVLRALQQAEQQACVGATALELQQRGRNSAGSVNNSSEPADS